MSRGPGHVERRIEALFAGNPTTAFSTGELLSEVYLDVSFFEKKHRVALLRAANKVAKRLGWKKFRYSRMYQSDLTDRGVVFFNACDVRSYAVGRLRAEYYPEAPLEDIFNKVDHDPKYKKLTKRGGYWWLFAQQERVACGAVLDRETQRLVDTTEAERLKSLGILSEKIGEAMTATAHT